MNRVRLIFVVFVFCFLCVEALMAQTIPVGMQVMEDYYRRLQLLKGSDSIGSFSIRPINKEFADGYDILYLDRNGNRQSLTKGIVKLTVLPLSLQQKFDSNHPYGWNDGAMIPAKGYQSLLSGGVFVKVGPFSVQLRPEYLYAQNPHFKTYDDDRQDGDIVAYYSQYNFIDAPETFGTTTYQKLLWGQSNVRLTVGPVSVGLSNENLWWGPGKQNSLLLGNNSRGFKHLTLNTIKPLKTKIGSFEAQIIAGRLEESGYSPLKTKETSNGLVLFDPPKHDWRYLTGINVNYQPKWTPGLYLGFIRTFMSYGSDLSSVSDYFPFFTPFQKVNYRNGFGDDASPRDQRTSFYTRWVFPKAHAEIYFEYGLNDNSYNLRDFIGSPQHSRAYLFGLSKLVALKGHSDEYLEFNAEITQTSQTVDGLLIRDASGFYYHSTVRQGYTHYGEVIGAGTGSGGNLQTIELSWVKGLKKLGLSVNRYEHNADFYDASVRDFNGYNRSWVDFAFAIKGNWSYRNFIFNAKTEFVKSLNYQWRMKDYSADKYYIPNNDVFNFHGELGVTYRF